MRNTSRILMALFIALLVTTTAFVVVGHSAAANHAEKAAPESPYLVRTLTYKDIMQMMKKWGVREPGKNYNVIVDGHGTGLAPPTLEEYLDMIGRKYVEDVKKPVLRSSVDLSQSSYFPPVGNQGQQGSCAGWATSYYANTYLQAKIHNWRDVSQGNSEHIMSPAWTYNMVNGGQDQGSFFDQHYKVQKTIGGASWKAMPYRDTDYTSWGDEDAWRSAPMGRIEDYETTSATNIDVIKSWLNDGSLVNFAINANAYDAAFRDGNYIMSYQEYYSYASSPNHAQTIVGYDDSVYDDGDRGAFLVVNSWGTSWGDHGFFWITYNAFARGISQGHNYAYRVVASKPNNPHLLAVWKFSSAPTRQDTATVGLQNGGSRQAYWEGSNYRLPSFMCMDMGEFESEWQNGKTTFYVKIGGTSSGTISSFKIEYYANGYDPGNPTDVSSESPDVPARVPGTVTNTYEGGGPGPTPEAPKVVSTYPEDGATNVPTTLSHIYINFSKNMDLNSLHDAISITPSVDFSIGTNGDNAHIVLNLGGGPGPTPEEKTEGNSQEGTLLASVYYAYTTAQTFRLSEDGDVTSVELYMLRVGNPPYDCKVEIRALDSSGYPTGSVLGTTYISASQVGTSLSWVKAKFSSAVHLRGGVSYAIVLSMNGGDSNNRYRWGVVDGDVYSNGVLWQKQSGTWYSFSGYDASFLVHYTVGKSSAVRAEQTLENDTTYTVKVSTAAKDTDGNHMENDYVFSFSTGGGPGPTPTEKTEGNSQEGTLLASVYWQYTTAQSFRLSEDGYVTSVEVYLLRVGNPDTCTVYITTLDSSGYPDQVLGTAYISASQVGTSLSWVKVTFSDPVYLKGGVSYALVLYMNGGDSNNRYRWGVVDGDVYSRGILMQYNYYYGWNSYSGYDASFLVHYTTERTEAYQFFYSYAPIDIPFY